MLKYSSHRRRWLRQFSLGIGMMVLPNLRTVALETANERFDRAEFVYISPAQSNGAESRCHGEVWFAWLDQRIVIVTARDTWKYRAFARGLDRAHLWVGGYGRWRGWFGRRNAAFKASPRLAAKAQESRDALLLERLLRRFAVKYPDEFPDWEQEQRDGFHAGRRTLLIYELTT